jgi:hypothetical protein
MGFLEDQMYKTVNIKGPNEITIEDIEEEIKEITPITNPYSVSYTEINDGPGMYPKKALTDDEIDRVRELLHKFFPEDYI